MALLFTQLGKGSQAEAARPAPGRKRLAGKISGKHRKNTGSASSSSRRNRGPQSLGELSRAEAAASQQGFTPAPKALLVDPTLAIQDSLCMPWFIRWPRCNSERLSNMPAGSTRERWPVPKTKTQHLQGESRRLRRWRSLVPVPDSTAHPQQRCKALSETCWINKYSRDTPGHVFFMSSFRYQKPHPLRRSDASVTEVTFIMNNLFEKLVLIISVKEMQFGFLCSVAEAGGML